MRVKWHGPANLKYRVQAELASVWTDVRLIDNGNSSTTAIDFETVIYGFTDVDTAIGLRVRSEDLSSQSAWVTIAGFTTGHAPTDATDLPPPSGDDFGVGGITSASALVTWTDALDNEANWQLRLTRAGGTPLIIHVGELETSYLLTGLIPGTDYTVEIRAIDYTGDIVGDWSEARAFTATTASDNIIISGGSELVGGITAIVLHKGAAPLVSMHYVGPGEPESWSMSGGPSGLTIAVPTWADGNKQYAEFQGAPGEEGAFDAIIAARRVYDLEVTPFYVKVRIYVEGRSFLAWLHNDPEITDLQLDLRTKALTSYKGVTLRQGVTATLHAVMRDSALLLEADFEPESLRFVVREENKFDGAALIDASVDVAAVDLRDGHRSWPITFAVDSPAIDAVFTERNRASGADAASASIAAVGELVVTKDGVDRRSKPVPVTIEQSYAS